MQRNRRLLIAAALAVGLGCDSGTSPVAPKDGVTLRITANPLSISLDGESSIRIELLDSARGTPVREGTEVQLRTTLGTIEAVVTTDRDGIARATLHADGRTGDAKVTASSGTNEKEITVKIGSTDLVAAFTPLINGLTVFFQDDSKGDPATWSWDFGDGGTSSEREPTHTYARADTYLVRLTVTNPDGSDSVIESVAVTGSLVADFVFAADGLTVRFSDTSQGDPTAWRWDFGDGNSSRERHPTHTYASAGSYRVTLTVSSSEGSATISKVVAVTSGAPEADFDHKDVGLTVTFTDQSSNEPTSWQWSFGDGNSSLVQNPVHTYAAPGTYRVTLTASNDQGSDTKTEVIEVDEPQRPVANFTFVVNGLNVDFTDRSTNEPTDWSWNFGEPSSGAANTSDLQNPAHRYGTAGTYTVTLTVENGAGESIVSKEVMVQ